MTVDRVWWETDLYGVIVPPAEGAVRHVDGHSWEALHCLCYGCSSRGSYSM